MYAGLHKDFQMTDKLFFGYYDQKLQGGLNKWQINKKIKVVRAAPAAVKVDKAAEAEAKAVAAVKVAALEDPVAEEVKAAVKAAAVVAAAAAAQVQEAAPARVVRAEALALAVLEVQAAEAVAVPAREEARVVPAVAAEARAKQSSRTIKNSKSEKPVFQRLAFRFCGIKNFVRFEISNKFDIRRRSDFPSLDNTATLI
jgi:hypothetical protein